MSVIIKGVEMPEGCAECPCAYFTEGAYHDFCRAVGYETNIKDYGPYMPKRNTRPDWCPLRPAPEWISVETPPEEEGEYDVYTERQEVLTTVGLYDIYGNIVFMETGVTHWRPRPEPPVGGDGDA